MGARGPLPKKKPVTGRRYPTGVPPAPDWLNAMAQAEYSRVAQLLGLTHADHGPLVAYAQAFGEIALHTQALASEGYTAKGDRGAVLNPRVRALTAARAALLECAAVLGLTPAARTRLPPDPADASAPAANGPATFTHTHGDDSA